MFHMNFKIRCRHLMLLRIISFLRRYLKQSHRSLRTLSGNKSNCHLFMPLPHFSASTAHVTNKTRTLNVSTQSLGWNFVTLSWNAVKSAGGHVTYRVTSEGRNNIIDKVTSNTSLRFSGLDQLTRYKIKVQAQEKNGGSLLASAAVVFYTLGEF